MEAHLSVRGGVSNPAGNHSLLRVQHGATPPVFDHAETAAVVAETAAVADR